MLRLWLEHLVGLWEPLFAVGWLVLVGLNGSHAAEDASEQLAILAQTMKSAALRDANIMDFHQTVNEEDDFKSKGRKTIIHKQTNANSRADFSEVFTLVKDSH